MPPEVKLRFCDLCGHSIPQRDLDTGITKTVNGKTLGACCLAGLLEAERPRAKEAAGGAGKGTGGLFSVALLLVAILAATLFGEWRAFGRSKEGKSSMATLRDRVSGIEQGFRRLDTKVGSLPMEDIQARLGALQSEGNLVRQSLEKVEDSLGEAGLAEVGALRRRIETLSSQLTGLSTRQALAEQSFRNAFKDLTGLCEEVDRGIRELQARAVLAEGRGRATERASPRGEGPKREPVAALSADLRKNVNQLRSSEPGVRWSAVDELLRSGDARVLPYLFPMLEDEDPFIRRLCAEGLGRWGDKRSARPLLATMEDNESIVRTAAYRALVKVSGKNLPFDPEASASKRKAYLKKWKSWIDANFPEGG